MTITTLAWALLGLVTTCVWIEWGLRPLRCEHCHHRVPRGFGERLPMGDGGTTEYWCRVCLGESDRYPKLWEGRERVEEYIAAQRAAIAEEQAEARRLEDARIVTCPVCEKDVKHGETSRAAVDFSTTPGRQMRRDSSVCFVCMEEHVGYGMPLVVSAALTWKRKENGS